ncbi:hypothetical protein NLX78_26285, partial [Paenibacillus sp. Lou8.1]|uniref:hypothetical protein n=1 Tax=Paenibacillus sp. Lou8.1 TaxID=2962041 RepID=UPI0020B8C581
FTHSLFSFQRSNISLSPRFSAAIRSYHVRFKNARVIFLFFEDHFHPSFSLLKLLFCCQLK